jgi:hypothetical protein
MPLVYPDPFLEVRYQALTRFLRQPAFAPVTMAACGEARISLRIFLIGCPMRR